MDINSLKQQERDIQEKLRLIRAKEREEKLKKLEDDYGAMWSCDQCRYGVSIHYGDHCSDCIKGNCIHCEKGRCIDYLPMTLAAAAISEKDMDDSGLDLFALVNIEDKQFDDVIKFLSLKESLGL